MDISKLKIQKRFQLIQDLGCVPCRLRGLGYNPPDIHHWVEGRKRKGDRWTYGNCPWHHRGVIPSGYKETAVKEVMGPSLARNPKEYHEEFGTEEYLVNVQDEFILTVLDDG